MNQRIKKKKEKQLLTWIVNELAVELKRGEERQKAAIQRAAIAYVEYLDEVMGRGRERQYSISKELLQP